MTAIQISPESIAARYAQLAMIGAIDGDPVNGYLRAPYSDAENEALQWLEDIALEHSLTRRRDRAGNLVIETPGIFQEWIETGSHIDTVPGGGNYDGAAGVVAGLEAMLAIQACRKPLQRGLRLRVWRGEESATFGVTSIGSRASFGQLNTQTLDHRWQGLTLREAMQQQGVDPGGIASGEAIMDANERDSIAAYIELHIEQGKVLESLGLDIGIVTAIRGSRRSWVSIRGTFDHSGATPMGSEFRQDANLAMAYMQVGLDQLLQQHNVNGGDLVQTIGLINPSANHAASLPIADNAVTKVSGAACFSFEVRGCDTDAVEQYCNSATALIQETARRFCVTATIDTFSDQPGIAALSPEIQQRLQHDSKRLGLSHTKLPSGAWHDAGTVAGAKKSDGSPIPVGMIFIPCRGGISHSPDEYASPAQIASGASLLATSMAGLVCA